MNEILKETFGTQNTEEQTPIEIALGVDAQGMTTATKLYEFLELNPTNYSKWFKKNIIENQFAEEEVDYFRFVLKYESGDDFIKERQDAHLTASFAKKLSMTSKSRKGESRQQALRKCIREFNERGIPAFVDKSGREWTPEAYVNMAMRSTSNTMAAEIQMARADDLGIDLVEVDSHAGARPKCAKDQGKIFDRANKSKKYPHWKDSSYGEPDGLLGINCGHHIYPFIEGVSIRRYFPTEDMDANDKLYKQIQVQRALERSVRKQKRECMFYDEIGDKEDFEKAAVKLKQKEAKLKSYVDGNDKLFRRKGREQVVGFDKSISSKAVAANKAYTKAMNTDRIPLKDTRIHRAVGAKARNYDIRDPDTGKIYHFAEGTRVQNSEVFAGKGTRHPLHEGVPEGLTEQFGGSVSKWQHCKGHGIIDYDGEERPAEVHWFQEETVGKVRFKVKRWEDED